MELSEGLTAKGNDPQPGCFMNRSRETVKMAVPPGRRLRNAECGLKIC